MESGGRGGLGSAPPLCGLINLGNTCYVNALLQMLCASEELVQVILNSGAAQTLGLADVIMQMRFPEKGQNAIAPYDFVRIIYSPHCTWVTSYKAKKDEQPIKHKQLH
jgi:ubiquitin C-terminal hydrolase